MNTEKYRLGEFRRSEGFCTRLGRRLGFKIPITCVTITDCKFNGLNADGTHPISIAPNGDISIRLIGWDCTGPNGKA